MHFATRILWDSTKKEVPSFRPNTFPCACRHTFLPPPPFRGTTRKDHPEALYTWTSAVALSISLGSILHRTMYGVVSGNSSGVKSGDEQPLRSEQYPTLVPLVLSFAHMPAERDNQAEPFIEGLFLSSGPAVFMWPLTMEVPIKHICKLLINHIHHYTCHSRPSCKCLHHVMGLRVRRLMSVASISLFRSQYALTC